MAITIDVNDTSVKQYIENLNVDTFVNSNNESVTYGSNYQEIIDIVTPKIENSRAKVNRLLSYYTDRYNRLSNRISVLEKSVSSTGLTLTYDAFNDFTVANLGIATSMDELAGTINYMLSSEMTQLKEWRRELKVLTVLMANMQTTLDDFDSLAEALTTVSGELL